MNKNLDLHVTEDQSVVDCEELAAMFVEEWREPFVLPSEFHAETIVNGAEISDASIEKKPNVWRVWLRFRLVNK
jgi:hypothetical protein